MFQTYIKMSARASESLQWALLNKHNSFMLKQRGVKKPFSTEPMNLKNLHSFRYSGLVRNKALGIHSAPDNKGIVMSYKTKKARSKPAKGTVKVTYKLGARTTLSRVNKFIRHQNYRKDLRLKALRKASAILQGQKEHKPKKTRGK